MGWQDRLRRRAVGCVECLDSIALSGKTGLIQRQPSGSLPGKAVITRTEPLPCPKRDFNTASPCDYTGKAGGTACRFVIGMTILAPGGEHRIGRLDECRQLFAKPLFLIAGDAVGKVQPADVYGLQAQPSAGFTTFRQGRYMENRLAAQPLLVFTSRYAD